MKKYAILLPFLISPAYAAVVGVGEYRFGPETSENFACEVAKDLAKRNVISNILGEKIDVVVEENCLNNQCNHNQQTFNSFEGNLKKIEVKQKYVGEALGYRYCKITVHAEVEPLRNDINFTVSGSFSYKVDEQVEFKLVSNQTGKIVLFNFYDGKFFKVYEQEIKNTDVEHTMPTTGKKIVASMKPGQWQSKEILLFLFYQGSNSIRSEYTPIEMENLIMSIPSDSRRVVKRYINIKR